MKVYEVSALGLAGEFVRPIRLQVPDQAAAVLPYIGGFETVEVNNVQLNGLVHTKAARSTVMGGYDENRGQDNALASVVIEDLNICDMVTADRVVARLSAFWSAEDKETRFSLSGTHFVNLRIAGRPVTGNLDINAFNKASTFSRLQNSSYNEYLHGARLTQDVPYYSSHLDSIYKELHRFSEKKSRDLPSWYSLANHVQVEGSKEGTDVEAFGSILYVPDFGIIHLAEFFVTQNQRRLSMLRLQLGSPIEANLVVATCNVGDTTDSTGPR